MPDIQPANQQPISDDEELAKVLAGVDKEAEEVVVPEPAAEPEPEPISAFVPPAPVVDPATTSEVGLDQVKKDAIVELKPLVDKLDLPPEEKFDTYLLLIRSTDDKELIAPAHEAAKGIVDESRRAQALLDIIKEIDYLNSAQAAQSPQAPAL